MVRGINSINPDCANCELFANCKTVCHAGSGHNTAKMVIVFESPSHADDADGTTTQADFIMKIMEELIGADQADIYITHLIKCRTLSPTVSHVEACREYLAEELQRISPKVVIGVGLFVSQVLSGKELPLGQLRDTMRTSAPIGGNTYLLKCVYAPNYILASLDARLPQYAKDLNTAYQAAIDYKPTNSITQVVKVSTLDQVYKLIEYCEETGVCSFDFETSGLDWYAQGFFATLLSISFQAGSSYAIPLFHKESPFSSQEIELILNLISSRLFESTEIIKIAHNLKFDMHVAAIYGMKFKGRLNDTMVMSHILDETRTHGLKPLVASHFPQFAGYDGEVAQYVWANVPLNVLSEYGGIDTDMTLRLFIHFEAQLLQDERLYKLYRNLQMPFLAVAFAAEHRGMKIDREYLEGAIVEAEKMISEVELRLRKYKPVLEYELFHLERAKKEAISALTERLERLDANRKNGKTTATENKLLEKLRDIKTGVFNPYEPINFGSPVQLSELLYSRKFGVGFKFEMVDGMDSLTGKETLAELKDKTGFVDDLLLYRSLQKTKSTYLQGILERLDEDNCVHTNFLQHGTRSGRLSSSDPNLQNIPDPNRVKNEEAKRLVAMVKSSFIAPKGYILLQADYSQAELRVAAEFSGDEMMIQAYRDGLDLHALTASRSVGLSIEEFYKLDPKEQKGYRQKAKAQNFGLLYGMSAQGFKDYAKHSYGVVMSMKEAEKARNDFFKIYSKLNTWHTNYVNKGKKFGYVRTLFGRKRRLPDIKSSDNFKRSSDERVAVNSPIQGTAGEFTIFGIVIANMRLDSRVLFANTIHDSIIYYVPEELLQDTVRILKETFENLPTLEYFDRQLEKVSMVIDVETSKTSWRDLKPI
jgi:DNA polymerase I